MRRLLFLVAFFVTISGCKKYKELKDTDDLSGTLYYSGQMLFVNDLDSQGIAYPRSAVHVQLFKASDQVNYLFDTITDNMGYLVFRNLKNGDYRLHINTRVTNAGYTVIYDSSRPISIRNDQNFIDVAWVLKPSETKQNGIVFTIRDGFGGFLNGTKIFLYSSSVLAVADVNTDGTGASVILSPTNGYGKSVTLNIPALPFYAVKMKTVNNLVKSIVISGGIGQTGIKRIDEQIP